jgi:glycosyltransferase involved in cell wall biosynthesis
LKVVRTADRWTAPLTTHFHAITETVKAAAVTELGIPARKISVVPRGRSAERIGVRSSERRRRVRQALGLNDDDPVLMSVGRQEYQKGHAYLLEAMPAVLSCHPTATLLLIGREGAASAHLRAVLDTARIAQGRIVFLGHREDVMDLMAAADVFVFPSLWEGLGGVLIEAMGLGLPIIASDLPAIREVIEDGPNGYLVPPGSPQELGSAIVRLLENPELQREQSQNNRKRFLNQFDLAISAGRMIDLYRQVASLGSRPARTSRDRGTDGRVNADPVRSSRAG